MTEVSIRQCAQRLAHLISFRTENPGGDEVALCQHLGEELDARGADHVEVVSVPRDGSRGGYVYAKFGTPKLLINSHIDTVPVNNGWTRDPFDASITDDRVVGLGAADTKGAAAAILSALEMHTPKDVGVLFSGDEERTTTCIHAFLDSDRATGIERAIVCEPTARTAGVRHRGVGAYRATVTGKGGHSSAADHMPKPVVTMARLAVALDQLGATYLAHGPNDMKGLCMNIASLDGGVAFNVVPDNASLTWSIRPPPGFDQVGYDAKQRGVIDTVEPTIAVQRVLGHTPFECGDMAGFRTLLGPAGSQMGPLQFWTEAAVLSRAGIDAVVIGPGDIAQAHAADEFVTLADLEWAVQMFTHAFETTHH